MKTRAMKMLIAPSIRFLTDGNGNKRPMLLEPGLAITVLRYPLSKPIAGVIEKVLPDYVIAIMSHGAPSIVYDNEIVCEGE